MNLGWGDKLNQASSAFLLDLLWAGLYRSQVIRTTSDSSEKMHRSEFHSLLPTRSHPTSSDWSAKWRLCCLAAGVIVLLPGPCGPLLKQCSQLAIERSSKEDDTKQMLLNEKFLQAAIQYLKPPQGTKEKHYPLYNSLNTPRKESQTASLVWQGRWRFAFGVQLRQRPLDLQSLFVPLRLGRLRRLSPLFIGRHFLDLQSCRFVGLVWQEGQVAINCSCWAHRCSLDIAAASLQAFLRDRLKELSCEQVWMGSFVMNLMVSCNQHESTPLGKVKDPWWPGR